MFGYQGRANKYTQQVLSAGNFGTPGDAQTSIMVARANTTTTSQGQMFLDGSSAIILIHSNGIIDNTATGYQLDIMAIQVGTSNSARWLINDVHAVRGTGVSSVAIAGGNRTGITPSSTTGTVSSWSLAISANTTTGALDLLPTGPSAQVHWVGRVQATEVH